MFDLASGSQPFAQFQLHTQYLKRPWTKIDFAILIGLGAILHLAIDNGLCNRDESEAGLARVGPPITRYTESNASAVLEIV
jgi:hypothetical protein